MSWLLVLAFLLTPAEAQKRPERAPRPAAATLATEWPIDSISVEGARNYSSEQILTVAGLKAGQRVTPKDFEAARDRLAATGAFESTGFQFGPAANSKGYKLSFQIVEAGPFFPVRFEELGVPAEELRAALSSADPLFGAKIPATESLLLRYARTLEAHLASRGRKLAVAGKLLSDNAPGLCVVFRPATGLPAVARVKFLGSQVIPAATLQNAMSEIAVGTGYTEAAFRQLLEFNIRPLYDACGRVRVAFTGIQSERAQDADGVLVTVTVQEGPAYTLGVFQAEGLSIPPAELQKAAALKSGEPFQAGQVQAAVERIEQRLRREGYMMVRTRLDRKIDDRSRVVDVLAHFITGPRYAFGKLLVEGLDIQSEPVVRKMWALREGSPFNADYPDYFLKRLREDEVFDRLGSTHAATKIDEARHVVDVTLSFGRVTPEPKVPKEP